MKCVSHKLDIVSSQIYEPQFEIKSNYAAIHFIDVK